MKEIIFDDETIITKLKSKKIFVSNILEFKPTA